MDREFKFYPQDFGALTVTPLHMDLTFDVFDDHTITTSDFKLRVRDKSISSLELNAKNLEVQSVSSSSGKITYHYEPKENKIVITFGKQIPEHTEFIITTKTTCRPTKNVLEGLYYDETPKGAPPTMITQCQQWGFQRLAPCIDDMTAKCTYTTTIIADAHYSHLISNGDVVKPRKSSGKGRSTITYDNTKTPMAPYLFFLGCGTYDAFTKECEYPDGISCSLELLVFPGADKQAANRALEMLYNAVLWVNLFTGPQKYEQWEEKKAIFRMIEQRDKLKEKGDIRKLAGLRKEIKMRTSKLTLGYQYTGTVYREIAMQNSDFGGMENVGNTTITANKIMPFKDLTDLGFEYLIIVKVHEFYHNLNGSQVTGWSPFEIWLNEAVTVHIEKEYFAQMMGKDYERLDTVLALLSPSGGTFDQDTGSIIMPVEPDGFNDPNELITSVTYSKAPEFVRMIEQLLGEKTFVKGLDVYHATYKHANATRSQWIEAMEKVSGLNLKRMAQTWLKQTGYPTVHVKTTYDQKKKMYHMHLEQTGFKEGMYWEFPFEVALCDNKGHVLTSRKVFIQDVITTLLFNNIQKPAFVSLARGCSFYGKVVYAQETDEALVLQLRHDSDITNKYMAFYKLADKEKMRLLLNKSAEVSESFVALYRELLLDASLAERTGSLLLALTQSVEDEGFAHRYEEVFQVRRSILLAVAQKSKKDLLALYKTYARKCGSGTYVEKELFEIKMRMMKNLCLSLLSLLDTPDIHAIIKSQFSNPKCATDRLVAFKCYLESSACDKFEALDEFESYSKQNLVAWENFLGTVAGLESSDALDIIRKVEVSPYFRIEQSNDQRSLYARFARNKRKSLMTEEGRVFMERTLIKLSVINEYTTGHLLDAYAKIDFLDKKSQIANMQVICNVLKTLSKEKTPSVYNTLRRMIKGSTKALKAYEHEFGKIKFL